MFTFSFRRKKLSNRVKSLTNFEKAIADKSGKILVMIFTTYLCSIMGIIFFDVSHTSRFSRSRSLDFVRDCDKVVLAFLY